MNEENLTTLLTAYAASPAPETLESLVEGYLPLSRAIARKFAGRGVELDDLEHRAEERNSSAAIVRGIAAWFAQQSLQLYDMLQT